MGLGIVGGLPKLQGCPHHPLSEHLLISRVGLRELDFKKSKLCEASASLCPVGNTEAKDTRTSALVSGMF